MNSGHQPIETPDQLASRGRSTLGIDAMSPVRLSQKIHLKQRKPCPGGRFVSKLNAYCYYLKPQCLEITYHAITANQCNALPFTAQTVDLVQ